MHRWIDLFSHSYRTPTSEHNMNPKHYQTRDQNTLEPYFLEEKVIIVFTQRNILNYIYHQIHFQTIYNAKTVKTDLSRNK